MPGVLNGIHAYALDSYNDNELKVRNPYHTGKLTTTKRREVYSAETVLPKWLDEITVDSVIDADIFLTSEMWESREKQSELFKVSQIALEDTQLEVERFLGLKNNSAEASLLSRSGYEMVDYKNLQRPLLKMRNGDCRWICIPDLKYAMLRNEPEEYKLSEEVFKELKCGPEYKKAMRQAEEAQQLIAVKKQKKKQQPRNITQKKKKKQQMQNMKEIQELDKKKDQ